MAAFIQANCNILLIMYNFTLIEVTLHWSAVLFYSVATFANTVDVIFSKPRLERIAYRLIYIGLSVHSAALLTRWWESGHGPYMARYEVLSSNAWFALVIFLVFTRIYPRIRPASIIIFPGAFLLLGIGIFSNPVVRKMPPTLSSIWLVLHVSFYKIALATFLIALAFSLVLILKNRAQMVWLRRFPETQTMDLYAFRFAGFGFTFWGIGMLAGSVWAYQSWGRFWAWDPIENWSLITWGLFGIYLHMRRFFGWQGEKAAILYIVCFIVALVAIFFTPVFSASIHSEYFQ